MPDASSGSAKDTELVIDVACAFEQRRALAIVADVERIVAPFHEGAFRAGFELACEEITHRLRTEEWSGCLPPADSPNAGKRSMPALDAINSGPPTVDQMAERFLCWPIPKDFAPDCGIQFTPIDHPNLWPIGTNLLNFAQAREMVAHMMCVNLLRNPTATAPSLLPASNACTAATSPTSHAG